MVIYLYCLDFLKCESNCLLGGYNVLGTLQIWLLLATPREHEYCSSVCRHGIVIATQHSSDTTDGVCKLES